MRRPGFTICPVPSYRHRPMVLAKVAQPNKISAEHFENMSWTCQRKG